jgi:hypothetical protein
VPVVPSCLLEPIWVEFHATIGGDRPPFHPKHPLGCHRRRIPDRIVFEHVIDALVHGSGYERIATQACSDRTIRRRLAEWSAAGVAHAVHAAALRAYDLIIGVQQDDILVDGCITKAPCGGDKAGPSPVDRGKHGLKRSAATDGGGIPLGLVSTPANHNDSPLLAPTLHAAITQVGAIPAAMTVTAHLDAAYDNAPSRALLDELGLQGAISRKGVTAPIQAGKRWMIERTHSWMNGYGKLRRCTDHDGRIVDFYEHLHTGSRFRDLWQLSAQARCTKPSRCRRAARRGPALVGSRQARPATPPPRTGGGPAGRWTRCRAWRSSGVIPRRRSARQPHG